MWRQVGRRFRAQRAAMAGLVALTLLATLCLLAPLIAPSDPADPLSFDPLAADHPPSLSYSFLLGADSRGRSLLALGLWGGRASLTIGVGAAALAAGLGMALGGLALWRGGALAPALGRLMALCQAAPPVLLAMALSSQLGGLPTPGPILVFAAVGWVAPARLSQAAAATVWRAAHVEAARAMGVGRWRLLTVHVLPDVVGPVVAWACGTAAGYVALEAGLDFLGLGLPPGVINWGTALNGAQDALVTGNWWWMTAGGLALATATLSLSAIAGGLSRALDPAYLSPVRRPTAQHDAPGESIAPLAGAVWRAWQPGVAPVSRWGRLVGRALLALLGVGALAAGAAALGGLDSSGANRLPQAAALVRQAQRYHGQSDSRFAYIAQATYAATEAGVAPPGGVAPAVDIPWAAWAACPVGLRSARCVVSLWSSAGRARALLEGNTFVCTPALTWGLNPMAGLARTTRRACGPLGPDTAGLGATAARVAALLPDLRVGRGARVLGSDVAASRRCWTVRLSPIGRACLDAETGLPLRLQRLDTAGDTVASFEVTAISYGLRLAPELFGNPIPGGRGPLLDSLAQPLLTLQSADDQALFTALVPAWLPAGLTAQTPTLDSFYDNLRGYSLQQRVRQTYTDRLGRVALVLSETLPGSAWDITPPRSAAHSEAARAGQRLLVWTGRAPTASVARLESMGTAALLSSALLSPAELRRVALGLQ